MDTGYCWIFYPAQCIHIFSSPKWKTQVSYSDHNLSIVCQHCCCSCCYHHKLFTFLSPFTGPNGQIQSNLAQSNSGINVYSNKLSDILFFKWEIIITPFISSGHIWNFPNCWYKYFKIMQGCSLMQVVYVAHRPFGKLMTY